MNEAQRPDVCYLSQFSNIGANPEISNQYNTIKLIKTKLMLWKYKM